MTAKYVFHLENGAELPTREKSHPKWDLTNNAYNNSVILDRSFPLLSTTVAKLGSKAGTDLEDTLTVSTVMIWGLSFQLVIDGALIK